MIFGLKLLSILWLVNLSFGLPAEYQKNSPTSIVADESRHFHHSAIDDSDFVPIIPSPIDPHPIISLHSDPQLNPIDFFSSFYRNRHHLSTSRPFAVRHISSTTSTRQQQHVSSTHAPTTNFDSSLLGSGNFAIMRGGTFYPEENDEDYRYGSGTSFFDNAGRPFALPLERPKQQKPQQFSDNPFANFKDFADITAGADVSDFSNLVVIYANRNSTKHEPRNILEQLQLLDQQNESENHETEVSSTSLPIKSTKLSKFKTKLRSTKLKQKEYAMKKVQKPKQEKKKNLLVEDNVDYVDPLVADS
ncbi:hypothetical protein PVAND_013092 [Polypedilum vanderplanki]|uniref:Uncharacterized protein n=1 Tax=Polypedilum vanderplanki TaxID=319348 RepID=A0A9J6CPB8_POLVA|nr:hypothetical protein PVAND_013092 [Polypedilum vanderplanki]